FDANGSRLGRVSWGKRGVDKDREQGTGNREQGTGISRQLSVVSCQLSVVSGQWSVVSGQRLSEIRGQGGRRSEIHGFGEVAAGYVAGEGEGLAVEGQPSGIGDAAGEGGVDAGLGEGGGEFKQGAEQDHVGGADIAEGVGFAGEVGNDGVDVGAIEPG